MLPDLAIQFIERVENLLQDLVTAGCEAVDPRRLGAFWFRRAKPPALRHSRQHRIERPRTQAIAVVVQLVQHPMTINALFGSMVEDMDLPEREEKLANDWIAHAAPMIPPRIGRLPRLSGQRIPAIGRGRCVFDTQEGRGQHHHPQQEHADVDALPYAYPRRGQIRRDAGRIQEGQRAKRREDHHGREE